MIGWLVAGGIAFYYISKERQVTTAAGQTNEQTYTQAATTAFNKLMDVFFGNKQPQGGQSATAPQSARSAKVPQGKDDVGGVGGLQSVYPGVGSCACTNRRWGG